MRLREELRENWFVTVLSVAMASFFLVAAIVSAATYASVARAHRDIVLGESTVGATLLENGSLLVTYTVTLDNPTRYTLHIYSVSWSVYVVNGTEGAGRLIVLGTSYTGPGRMLTVDGRSIETYALELYVSAPDKLDALDGLVAHAHAQGVEYTLETIPFAHEFEVVAWLGEFAHDYDRELYLNDLVQLDLVDQVYREVPWL
jgi:hypothetical protein